MNKKFIFFYCVNFFSLAASTENNDFWVKINDWEKAKLLVSEQLINQEIDYSEEQGFEFTLKTESGINVPVKFYDRNSEVCMIVACSLPAPKEKMEIFAKVFSSYDVVLFDYRWANHHKGFFVKSIFSGNPVKKVLLDPIEELETVVHYFAEKKKYNSVIGLGECYGCFHLAKLQSDAMKKQGMGPFTKLVLDSCWYSLQCFAQSICCDPYLPFHPRYGGAPRIVKWLTDNYLVNKVFLDLVFMLMNNISIEPYIEMVGIPVLFIHGQNDLLVPPNSFDRIWNASNKESRAVLFTPYRHSDNLGNKNLYRHIVEKFIASRTMQDFEKMCSELTS